VQQLTTEVIEITPLMAKRLLDDEGRPRNRTIRPREVEKLAAAMQSNTFDGTIGETLVLTAPLDKGGKLLDGQHRLKAIEITGIPQKMLAVYGVESSALAKMGQGRKRSIQDFLTIHNIPDAGNVAAAVIQMIVWEAHHTFEPRKAGYTASPDGVLDWITDHERIVECVKRAHAIRDWGLPVSTIAALYYLFSEKDREDAEIFFTRLRHGIDLEEDDPILALREKMRTITATRRRLPRDEFAAICIKAWNAYRNGEPIKALSFRVGGARPEKMPEII
jgi:hypothetical protein